MCMRVCVGGGAKPHTPARPIYTSYQQAHSDQEHIAPVLWHGHAPNSLLQLSHTHWLHDSHSDTHIEKPAHTGITHPHITHHGESHEWDTC